MADEPIAFHTLLGETRAAIDGIVAASARERNDRKAIDKALGMLGDEVNRSVREACNQDVVGLLVSGWSKAEDLRGYTDSAKYPPTQTVRMALAQHTMAIAIDPELTLEVAGLPLHKLKLIIVFDADIQAAVLIIKGGAIIACEPGSIRFAAKLRWGSTELPVDLKTRELTIPGRIRIDPPVAIRKPAAAPAAAPAD